MLAIVEMYKLASGKDGFTWEMVERFEFGRDKLRLLLNLNEDLSKEVMSAADDLRVLAHEKFRPDEKYREVCNRLSRSTAAVLKQERERVKRGE